MKTCTKLRRTARVICAALSFCCLATIAHAQGGTSVLTFSLDQATATAAPGQTVVFSGVLTNSPTDSGGTGDTLTLTAANPIVTSSDATIDASPFLTYILGTSDTLAPNATSGDISLFDVDILAGATAGEVINGTFEIDYSDSAGNSLSAGPENFTINVAAPTPEPSAFTVLLIAVLGLGMLMGSRSLRSRQVAS